jgi:hypothetical protein
LPGVWSILASRLQQQHRRIQKQQLWLFQRTCVRCSTAKVPLVTGC